jgi:hypothetical protein
MATMFVFLYKIECMGNSRYLKPKPSQKLFLLKITGYFSIIKRTAFNRLIGTIFKIEKRTNLPL